MPCPPSAKLPNTMQHYECPCSRQPVSTKSETLDSHHSHKADRQVLPSQIHSPPARLSISKSSDWMLSELIAPSESTSSCFSALELLGCGSKKGTHLLVKGKMNQKQRLFEPFPVEFQRSNANTCNDNHISPLPTLCYDPAPSYTFEDRFIGRGKLRCPTRFAQLEKNGQCWKDMRRPQVQGPH